MPHHSRTDRPRGSSFALGRLRFHVYYYVQLWLPMIAAPRDDCSTST
jgi:hypothetical protein